MHRGNLAVVLRGFQCIDEICEPRATCSEDGDCPPDFICEGGFCYASSLTEVPCSGGPGDVGYWTDTQGG